MVHTPCDIEPKSVVEGSGWSGTFQSHYWAAAGVVVLLGPFVVLFKADNISTSWSDLPKLENGSPKIK